jgi:hypothetical protein
MAMYAKIVTSAIAIALSLCPLAKAQNATFEMADDSSSASSVSTGDNNANAEILKELGQMFWKASL